MTSVMLSVVVVDSPKKRKRDFTLEEKYRVALDLLHEVQGWTETKVLDILHKGWDQTWRDDSIAHVKAHHNCLCDFYDAVTCFGEEEYCSKYFVHKSLVERLLEDVDDEHEGCDIVYWKEYCHQATVQQLNQLTLEQCEKWGWKWVLERCQFEYTELTQPWMQQALQVYLRTQWLPVWLQGKEQEQFQEWFDDEVKTIALQLSWFTELEWHIINKFIV